ILHSAVPGFSTVRGSRYGSKQSDIAPLFIAAQRPRKMRDVSVTRLPSQFPPASHSPLLIPPSINASLFVTPCRKTVPDGRKPGPLHSPMLRQEASHSKTLPC